MKKIDITQIVSPSSKQPFTANSLDFLQNALDEDKASLVKALIISNLGSYSLTTGYIISGCVLSDSNKDITAGEIFYGGKFYETTAVNGVTNPCCLVLTKTQDAIADPLTFTDGVTKNVHNIYKFVATDATVGSHLGVTDILGTSLVSVYSTKITTDIKTSLYNTNSISYVGLTSMSYTTPNDGVTRKFLIIGNSVFNYSTSTGNGSFLQLWNGSTELALTSNYAAIQTVNIDRADLPLSLSYVGLIPPNTTLTLRVKMSVSASSNFINNSLSIVEI